jgi:hypothetical protein
MSDVDGLTVGSFQRIFGLSESEALRAVQGRERPTGFAGLTHMFRGLGLSEHASEVAAVGRDHRTVDEARQAWDAAGSSASTDELDQWLERQKRYELEEARKRRTPAKKTTPAKQPSSSKVTTVSETMYPRGRR